MKGLWALCLWLGVLPGASAQWTVEPSGTDADLHAISAVSEQVAWASGDHGTVLRTVDGGQSWTRCSLPAEAQALDLRGVQGFDGTTALVMSSGPGELSRVYRTTDGGKRWEEVFRNPNTEGKLDSMQFEWKALPAPQHGYYAKGLLVGEPVAGEFVIYTSKDHGATWQDFRDDEAFSPGPPAEAHAGESVFAASNTALTATADDDSFAFVTGGPSGARLLYPEVHHQDFNYVSVKWTFSSLALPIPSGALSGGYSVAARTLAPGKVDLMIVGGDGSRPEVGSAVFVRHGGPILNVKRMVSARAVTASRPPGGFRSAVAYDAGLNSWITVGPNGTDMSRDDGQSWTRLSPEPGDVADADRNWQALSLPFAVGPHGRVGRFRAGTGTAAPMLATTGK